MIDLTIKNYRCFPDAKPARISLRKGFTAFLGVNNSGKTSLLKFFYEFRHLFQLLASASNEVVAALTRPRAFEPRRESQDHEKLFHRGNNRDIRIHFRLPPTNHDTTHDPPFPKEVIITVIRPSNTWTLEVVGTDGKPLQLEQPNIQHQGEMIILGTHNKPVVDLTHYFSAFHTIGNTLYIPAFRNAINVTANQNYFDITVGTNVISQWHNYRHGPSTVQNEIALSVTRDIKRIFGYDSLEINATNDGQTFQLIINERSYTLLDQGSGLAQFILVLTNVALQKPSFILIDGFFPHGEEFIKRSKEIGNHAEMYVAPGPRWHLRKSLARQNSPSRR